MNPARTDNCKSSIYSRGQSG